MKTVAAWSALVLAMFIVSPLAAENWPQWRGLNNDGISPSKDVVAKWSEKENIIWKLKLPGMAGSTPVIWGDKIIFSSQDGEDLVLMCVNKAGKELWKSKIATGKHMYQAKEGNDASPSPSTDGKHVFIMVSTGIVACFDLDGKEVWKFDAQERYGKFDIQFGMHSTPVLHENNLYLQLLHTAANVVIAVDKTTGKEVWKIDRKSDGRAECEHSYASPCIWSKGKDAYLITHGNDYTIAHNLKDGSEIWRLGDLNPKEKYNPTFRFVASPLATPDLIIVPTCKGGPVVAVKPDAKGKIGIGSTSEQWRMSKETPDVPSPLIHDGLVYLCRENGTLICLDAATGKQHYSERTHVAKYRASPVYADGKVFLTARDGVVSVVKAGTKFELLSTNKLSDEISASPAISNGIIYLRGWESLYAIGMPVQ